MKYKHYYTSAIGIDFQAISKDVFSPTKIQEEDPDLWTHVSFAFWPQLSESFGGPFTSLVILI